MDHRPWTIDRGPWSIVRRLDWIDRGGEPGAGQHGSHLGRDLLGALPGCFGRELRDRVLGENDRVVISAPEAGHCEARRPEGIGEDGRRRQPGLLDVDAIVHTAR